MYDKSDKYRTVFDSYNIKLARTKIESLLLENTCNSYSSFNNVEFDLDYKDDQYLLYMQFVTWHCDGSSMLPLKDYPNNKTFKELHKLNKYFINTDKKLFIDFRCGKGYSSELEKLTQDSVI